ncbi:hypothetical protein HQ576_13615 [bacterium]|nr:hypothetical protein [bacterium]
MLSIAFVGCPSGPAKKTGKGTVEVKVPTVVKPKVAAPKPKAQPRKCPADKVEIGGHDIAKVLAMLGAKRDVGATDEQLRAYASHFDRSDPNHDGKHTRAEYVEGGRYMTPQARAGIFRATDSNADDVVTRVEYVLNRIITDEAKAIVQRTDSDKDGKVTRAEFVTHSPIKDEALAGAVFDALDTGGDGVTTVPEYLRVWGGWARPNYKAQEAAIADRLAKLDRKSDNGGKGGTSRRRGTPYCIMASFYAPLPDAQDTSRGRGSKGRVP